MTYWRSFINTLNTDTIKGSVPDPTGSAPFYLFIDIYSLIIIYNKTFYNQA
jgi:hypothetical protein